MSNKAEVKLMIMDCQGLTMQEKSSLRRLLDQNVVTLDSMVVSGTLVSIPELKLVISDNQDGGNAGFTETIVSQLARTTLKLQVAVAQLGEAKAQLSAAQMKIALRDVLAASMTSEHLDELTATYPYAQNLINATTELKIDSRNNRNTNTTSIITWESDLWQEYSTPADASRKETTHVHAAFKRLTQAVDADAVWEFVDTHNTGVNDGTTQNFLMCVKGTSGTVTSAGLVVELTGQQNDDGHGSALDDFPSLALLGKLHRDMLRVLRRRGWKGFVHAVVTDLSRIVCFRMAMGAGGTIDSATVQRTPVEYGEKVRERMVAFLNHTPAELGVDEEFIHPYVVDLCQSSSDASTRKHLAVDKVLGAGAEGVVYRVSTDSHQDCCLKVFHANRKSGFKRELDVLRKLAGVQGVVRLRGQNENRRILMLSPVCKRTLESYRGFYCVEHVFRQLVVVLQSVHQSGFAYRDMRGSNVLVEEERVEGLGCVKYRVYLSDFGMAVPLGQERAYEGTVCHAARAVLDVLAERGVHAGVTCTAATDLESLVKMTFCLSQPLGLTLGSDPADAKDWWAQAEGLDRFLAWRLVAARALNYEKLALS